MTSVARILRDAAWIEGTQVVCLLHTPRSGANLLGGLIQSKGGGWAGDIVDFINPSLFEPKPAEDIVTDLLESAKRLVRKTRNGLCLFKIDLRTYAHFDSLMGEISAQTSYFDLRMLMPHLRYIRVVRDPIDRAISLAAARMSGVWSPMETASDYRNLDIEADVISGELNAVLREDLLMDLLCQELGPTIATVNYADITSPSGSLIETCFGIQAGNREPPLWVPRYEESRDLRRAKIRFLESMFHLRQVPTLNAYAFSS